MKQISLEFDDSPRIGLREYLLKLNGIFEVEITFTEFIKITIKYDPILINLNVIKLEIIAYLDLFNLPSLISFDKNVGVVGNIDNEINYDIIINNLCCEYCLRNMIDQLLNMESILSAYSDYGKLNFQKDKVFIHIKYDSNLITLEEIKQLSIKFKNY